MNLGIIEIISVTGKTICEVEIESLDWESIQYVDYIAIDQTGQVLSEYKYTYGQNVYEEMQSVVNRSIH